MRLTASSQLVLVSDARSSYKIVIPESATSFEQKASRVLQSYIKDISGASLPIVTDGNARADNELCIGKTNRGSGTEKLTNEGFVIKTRNTKLLIYGGDGKSVLYGVYHFLENYLDCRKFTAVLKFVPKKSSISLPAISDIQNPVLSFRSVYYPDQYDEEFRDWHKLHTLEDEFGLWGHTFFKLVSPNQYFKTKPEYFALVNGQRTDTQLCLSNPEVLSILTGNLRKLILEEPDKKLWSVSQNDGLGYCTCSKCEAIDKRYGGPQGSVINFANKVAAKFPDKTISTLAYLYSALPPVNLKPAANVSVMLSSISLDRAKPISSNPRAALFRNSVRSWSAITGTLMVWDYVVQYTNYQSPFPNLHYLDENMKFFADNNVRGIFVQGTEGSRGEFSALKTYLLAKASWAPKVDNKVHFEDFIKAYYGEAGQHILRYIDELNKELTKSGRLLDIYGDPVIEWNSWLSPERIDRYSDILDDASKAAGSRTPFAENVEAERLALEYAVIQQARFYGLERHGLFIRSGDEWSVRPGFKNKVQRFLEAAGRAGVKVLAEGGHTLDTYAKEWDGIFRQGPIIHEALGADVKAVIPFSVEYPGKGTKGLTDGSPGYNSFQYNYLGWYGTDMEVIIDLGKVMEVGSLSAGFLEDQRHWSFLPLNLSVEISVDDTNYHQAGSLNLAAPEEVYSTETHRYTINFSKKLQGRYVKLRARNLEELPKWRAFPNRKSWLFCDEIAVYK
ncbi:Glycosyl hydrolase family 67 N-terminus [Daejeonella lutea]|uniref:Glycosyl hydrolase family 67 N-terminus n=2 Tax=Daejeonella lutea TaxID=572036 RepID=A0A1T5CVR8_9SPHI|nr:Glycosyl hydrolase family 67 N-terminus [Daejeonella lutea]